MAMVANQQDARVEGAERGADGNDDDAASQSDSSSDEQDLVEEKDEVVASGAEEDDDCKDEDRGPRADSDDKGEASEDDGTIQGDEHGDNAEEAPIKRPKNPEDPTPEEKERHMTCGHLPYRPWCSVCKEARGREDRHFEQNKAEKEHGWPKISMDYAELGSAEIDEGREGVRKILVGRDKWSRFTFAHLVKCKGLGDERIVDKVMQSIKDTGYTKVRIKTDGEPAIIQVQ